MYGERTQQAQAAAEAGVGTGAGAARGSDEGVEEEVGDDAELEFLGVREGAVGAALVVPRGDRQHLERLGPRRAQRPPQLAERCRLALHTAHSLMSNSSAHCSSTSKKHMLMRTRVTHFSITLLVSLCIENN